MSCCSDRRIIPSRLFTVLNPRSLSVEKVGRGETPHDCSSPQLLLTRARASASILAVYLQILPSLNPARSRLNTDHSPLPAKTPSETADLSPSPSQPQPTAKERHPIQPTTTLSFQCLTRSLSPSCLCSPRRCFHEAKIRRKDVFWSLLSILLRVVEGLACIPSTNLTL